MTQDPLEHLKYPVGRFETPDIVPPEQFDALISVLEAFPDRLRAATESLSDGQLDTPYRPGGWTVRQVVHHCPDSHLNAYVRFKVALTEDFPTIKPYLEDRCAQLADYRLTPIGVSLDLLQALHHRWTILLRALEPADWARGYVHPEYQRRYTLSQVLALYAWHCRHHLAHVTELAKAERWV
jgi:hypothetical protein